MRAYEFLSESKNIGGEDTAKALPATYVLPMLKNQDPYMQYRFGVAIASAKGAAKRKQDNIAQYQQQSEWSENEVIVSFDPGVGGYIDDALQMLNIKGKKKMISTPNSEEGTSVTKTSPIQAFKGFNK